MTGRKIAFAALVASATVALLALPGQAQASDGCDSYSVNHNGSRMQVDNCGGSVEIYYTRPKSSLQRHGVSQGTTLFTGSIGGNGRLRGTAYRFKRGCGRVAYRVSGRYDPDGFTLSGTAPIRGSGCRVTRQKRDNLAFY